MTRTDDEMEKCICDVPKVKKWLIQEKQVNLQANFLKLLAHPTRLQILKLLSKRDLCVCVLSRAINKPQPNISQHLAKLKDDRLIMSYYVGKLVFYKIKDKRILNILKQL